MSQRKTSVALDSTLLKAVQDVLETTTIKATIEQAFLEVLKIRARRAEIDALASMEGMDLDNPQIMDGAWSH